MKACLRSGYCCKKGICPFGEWNKQKEACTYLIGGHPGKYKCAKYTEIIEYPDAEFSPAFGAGCCSSLNGDRQKLLRQKRSA